MDQRVSIHALLAECDRRPCGITAPVFAFQSTHSLRSATIMRVATFLFMRVSIHALLAECDKLSSSASAPINCFNPRTPCGVRRAVPSGQSSSMKFQSTHSLRSATNNTGSRGNGLEVSIHALLAECDSLLLRLAWRRTGFNPRTPCGVRQVKSFNLQRDREVSIHALLAECDIQPERTHQDR